MSAAWSHLRGEELSAFITQGLAANENEEFAEHLEQYGTLDDFKSWIKSPSEKMSVALARSFFECCPRLAQHILIDALDNDLIATIHLDVCLDLLGMESTDPTIVENVRSHINFQKIPQESHSGLLRLLLRAGLVDTILNNKKIFDPVVANDPTQMCIEAAHCGWDLASHFNVTPPLNDDYFVACCVGGLIDQAQQCAIAPSNDQTLRLALTLSLYRKSKLNPSNQNTIEYLWNTYPNTPWHNDSNILHFAYEAPLSVLPKILEHFKDHTPKLLKKHAIGLTCRCLEDDDQQRFDMFYPLITPAQRYNVFYTAISRHNEVVLNRLLEQTKGNQHFMKALEQCEDEEKEWGNAFYSRHQNNVLKNALPKNTPTPLRTQRKKI